MVKKERYCVGIFKGLDQVLVAPTRYLSGFMFFQSITNPTILGLFVRWVCLGDQLASLFISCPFCMTWNKEGRWSLICVCVWHGVDFSSCLLMHPWCAIDHRSLERCLGTLDLRWLLAWSELTGTSWFSEQAKKIEWWTISYTPNIWWMLTLREFDAWNTRPIGPAIS